MISRSKILFALLLFCLPVLPAFGQGLVADIVTEIEYVEGQVLKLAEAVPEDKYSWRPGEGVRSVGEVYMHIAQGNYFLLSMVGGEMPEGLREMDKQNLKKSEVIEALKKSYAYVKSYIPKLTEEDLEKTVDFFGNQSNGRRILLVCLYHNHEHLGQSIAYARVNGIVPPWSQSSEAASD
jgi:uncharacterized damage-inducible protein DinB